MPSRRQTSARRRAFRPPVHTVAVPVGAATFLEALLNYWNENAKADKAKNGRLIQTLAETFPHIEFLRLAATDPYVREKLDELTGPQLMEILGGYLGALLPTLSVEQVDAFAAKVFEGIEPEHLRRLIPHAARDVQTALVFTSLLPALVSNQPEGRPVTLPMGTASVTLTPTTVNKYRSHLLRLAQVSSARAEALGPDEFSALMCRAMLCGIGTAQWQQALEDARLLVGKRGLQGLASETQRHLAQLFGAKSGSAPSPASRNLQPPDAITRQRTVEQTVMLEDGRSFIQNGVRYFPLSSAAPVVQAPPSTILHWIKKETNFGGRPLDSYHFAPANRYFLSEESIERAANRFIKWPSQEPAGRVTLGDTDDHGGYIRLQEAAQTLGIGHHTIWRWATKGTAPIDKPLDVIKCPATDQFYIREADVSKLKKFVPRSGLHAGRRHQASPHPS